MLIETKIIDGWKAIALDTPEAADWRDVPLKGLEYPLGVLGIGREMIILVHLYDPPGESYRTDHPGLLNKGWPVAWRTDLGLMVGCTKNDENMSAYRRFGRDTTELHITDFNQKASWTVTIDSSRLTREMEDALK